VQLPADGRIEMDMIEACKLNGVDPQPVSPMFGQT